MADVEMEDEIAFGNLPYEVLLMVVEYLPNTDLYYFALPCRAALSAVLRIHRVLHTPLRAMGHSAGRVLQYAKEKDSFTEEVRHRAHRLMTTWIAQYGDLEALKFAHSIGFPWHAGTSQHLCKRADSAMMEFAFSDKPITFINRYGILEYDLADHDERTPPDDRVEFHEHPRCPIDFMAGAHLVQNGSMDQVRWLWENTRVHMNINWVSAAMSVDNVAFCEWAEQFMDCFPQCMLEGALQCGATKYLSAHPKLAGNKYDGDIMAYFNYEADAIKSGDMDTFLFWRGAFQKHRDFHTLSSNGALSTTLERTVRSGHLHIARFVFDFIGTSSVVSDSVIEKLRTAAYQSHNPEMVQWVDDIFACSRPPEEYTREVLRAILNGHPTDALGCAHRDLLRRPNRPVLCQCKLCNFAEWCTTYYTMSDHCWILYAICRNDVHLAAQKQIGLFPNDIDTEFFVMAYTLQRVEIVALIYDGFQFGPQMRFRYFITRELADLYPNCYSTDHLDRVRNRFSRRLSVPMLRWFLDQTLRDVQTHLSTSIFHRFPFRYGDMLAASIDCQDYELTEYLTDPEFVLTLKNRIAGIDLRWWIIAFVTSYRMGRLDMMRKILSLHHLCLDESEHFVRCNEHGTHEGDHRWGTKCQKCVEKLEKSNLMQIIQKQGAVNAFSNTLCIRWIEHFTGTSMHKERIIRIGAAYGLLSIPYNTSLLHYALRKGHTPDHQYFKSVVDNGVDETLELLIDFIPQFGDDFPAQISEHVFLRVHSRDDMIVMPKIMAKFGLKFSVLMLLLHYEHFFAHFSQAVESVREHFSLRPHQITKMLDIERKRAEVRRMHLRPLFAKYAEARKMPVVSPPSRDKRQFRE